MEGERGVMINSNEWGMRAGGIGVWNIADEWGLDVDEEVVDQGSGWSIAKGRFDYGARAVGKQTECWGGDDEEPAGRRVVKGWHP